ncbi:hypothetical protein [Sphingosinicella sp. YJ22]|uniref:hypothetical protein n=1 Tax=Sphingosinicella sp. YJ22 TaxID=1104780 RepID=UPI00140B624C|nr:hypothetical protein [Sphingosinicella sp. YJ22]
MGQRSDIEVADELSRRRARTLPLLAIIFLTQQASYLADRYEGPATAVRTVDHVKVGAWLILSIVLLLALTTGGFWFKSRNVRALLDDEVTRANRAEALKLGFVTTMISAFAIYGLLAFEPVSARDAIHLLVTIGVATALVRFGLLERRAHLGD